MQQSRPENLNPFGHTVANGANSIFLAARRWLCISGEGYLRRNPIRLDFPTLDLGLYSACPYRLMPFYLLADYFTELHRGNKVENHGDLLSEALYLHRVILWYSHPEDHSPELFMEKG